VSRLEKLLYGFFCRFYRWVNPDVSNKELALTWEMVKGWFWQDLCEDPVLLNAWVSVRLLLRR
jgi:hypothetical protein